jgi:SdrD B-like domain
MYLGDRDTTSTETARPATPGTATRLKAAGLAALLVPLASIAVVKAEPRSCLSGGAVCGVVWNDLNNNGIREAGEPAIMGAVITLGGISTSTNDAGYYQFGDVGGGVFQVSAMVPPGMQVSPNDIGSDDTVDSDGIADGAGNSVATITLPDDSPFSSDTDFGFSVSPVQNPGTGTPGYWMNHPEAWPADITIGGFLYTRDEAIAWIQKSGKDRTTTMFASLASAKLNVQNGNDPSCVQGTIDEADAWMAKYGPVGSNVHAASLAWKIGEPLHRLMDNYNNGVLCAPHRD